jgi:DNA-binding response OmpR family regulator
MQVDRNVTRSHALVIDGNPGSRGVLVQMLHSLGFGTVKQASRVLDAREMLEHRRFDLVVCEQHFDNSDETGQDLLEELRRENLLPYATVFVMVTGQATYASVAEAAEAALDSYLVRPFSVNTLFERIKEARQRKRELKSVFDALEAREPAVATTLCLQRFARRQLYWQYAARLAAELLLRQQRYTEARQLLEEVHAAKPLAWARLGTARVELAEGDSSGARRTLEALLVAEPRYADAHELLGQVQLEQGLLEASLASYGNASALTPGCVLRLQHCGTLNYYLGETAKATQMLERTWNVAATSRLFDVLSMQLLAFMRFDAADARALGQACDVMLRFRLNHPQSLRLQRFAAQGRVLQQLLAGQTEAAYAQARELSSHLDRPEFDMEAATTSLSLWLRLHRHSDGLVSEAEFQAMVQTIARRFSVSKASTEVLCAALQGHEPAAGWVRSAHAEVMHLASQAMNHALHGQPRTAVEMLLQDGAGTHNAKLIEMASLVARRHQDRITDVQGLLDTASTLAHRYCLPATHLAGVRRNTRAPGALVLRTGA